ncbi:glutamate--tRNA ligase, partial [bacterium (Candidatus Howlettbacteria) CG_4_10_14_0_8_um_filter_40_9]
MIKIRTRIAPSPTGKFHIGTARTALFNYLFAKKNSGDFLLRFEDTDRERSTKKFEDDIREGMKWLGMDWDEEYKQMDRLDIYKKYAEELIKKEISYEKDGAIWLKIPKDKKIKFKDLIRDEIEFDMKEFNDFVIVKSDGIPTFYFSNVIDDFDMKISHVIRGEDHITNTPKQILIAEALGFALPIYAHIPLILNPDKSKLSKRKNPVAVTDYKDKGYLPEAIINFLALLGWNPGDEREYFPLDELIKNFSLERVQKSPAVFDIEKLNNINSHYIKVLSLDRLTVEINKSSKEAKKSNPEFLAKIISLTQERLRHFSEFDELTDYFFEEKDYDPKILIFKKSDKDKTIKGLTLSKDILEKTEKEWGSVEKLNELLAKVVAENDLDNGDVFWPVRVALSGLEKSPSPTELLWALGKEESLKRLGEA